MRTNKHTTYFYIYIDYALRFESGYGVKVSNKQLFDLDLADDVFLLEESKERLQQLLDTILRMQRMSG